MPQKILIIEDDKFLRQLVVRKLSQQNFEIAEAVDGESGLEKAESEDPDLILLDLILPGMDGFEVLSEIEENPELSVIPVIILSNLGQKDEIEKGLQMGAEDYLVKAHFTLGEIIEKVKDVLE